MIYLIYLDIGIGLLLAVIVAVIVILVSYDDRYPNPENEVRTGIIPSSRELDDREEQSEAISDVDQSWIAYLLQL